MNRKFSQKHRGLGERGFTLIEIVVSLTILIVIVGSAMLVVHNSSRAKQIGDSLSEAQQNVRAGMNAIVSDLRSAGYSIDSQLNVPIEVASQYRMTMILDRDRDGAIGPGERITYFLDTDQSQQLTANSENPYDFVLRRVTSTNVDTSATPSSGAGDIVAYLITQRSAVNITAKDVAIFSYSDASGNNLMGTGSDPDNSGYGLTVTQANLGLPTGTGVDPMIATVNLNLVAETGSPASSDGHYRRFALGSQVNPANFNMDLVASFSVIDTTVAPTDTTAVPPTDTTVTDTTVDDILPPYEPPIRISTARVLSLDSQDLGELDSQEGSQTTLDYQFDMDLVLGTKAGSNNNLSAWWNGAPDKYVGDTYYQSVPNYYGTSPFDIQDIAITNLDYSSSPDVVCAVRVSDTSGGFQVWFNQDGVTPGMVGLGSVVTTPNAYYSSGTGQARAVLAIDIDNDSDNDIIIGTTIGSNTGRLEVWVNDGSGSFTQDQVIIASGEVNGLAAADFDDDGYLDIVAGTKTSNNDKVGKVEIFHNVGGTVYSSSIYASGGKVNAVGVADLNEDGYIDIVAGTKTGNAAGKIEYWQGGPGLSFSKEDEVIADGVVLSLDIGYIDLDSHLDIAAGNEDRSIQAWFLDPLSSPDVLPPAESWADANAGGDVHAVRIIRVEHASGGGAVTKADALYDIVIGTAISATEGEIVVYLNPYVWTLTP